MKQLSIFDLIPDEDNKAADICESCRYYEKGCCSYDEPLGRYCVEGSAYELKVPDNEDKCDSCLFCEDCYKFNVIRYESCVNYSNYIPKDEAPQFPESDFAEIVEYINNKLGLNFIRSDWQPEGDKAYYHCKVNKKLKLNLSKSRFAEGINDEREYIGVGWDIKTGGGGSPVDTVGEALDYFEDVLSKYK